MAFNASDPRYQRDLQKMRAKRSMGAGKGVLRSAVGRVTGQHATYQQGVKQSFRRLADQKKSRVLSHKTQMAGLTHQGRMLGMREDALTDQQKTLPYHIGGKLLSAIGSGYEGYRRKQDIKASNVLKEKRHQEILSAMKGGKTGHLSTKAGYGTGIYGFKLTQEEQ
jgi:hypothetical protein